MPWQGAWHSVAAALHGGVHHKAAEKHCRDGDTTSQGL